MITLVTLHIVHEPNREQALWLLRRNTELARQAPGFFSRTDSQRCQALPEP